jgi:hypothetical protein
LLVRHRSTDEACERIADRSIDHADQMFAPSIFTVDDKYFVYVGANRDLLTRLGFQFRD